MSTVNKQIVSHVIPVTIFLMTVYTVLPFLKPGVPMASSLNNTALWWAVSIFILIVFFLSRFYFFDKKNEDNTLIVWIYLFWNAVCIVRGIFVAEIYWDWKALISNAMALMLPVVIFSATNKMVVQSLLSFYMKYALPLFLIFAMIIRTDAFGFYLIPVSFLLLFLPVFTRRQKIILLIVTAVVFLADMGARSNVIKFGSPLLILLLYYFRKQLSRKVLEITRVALFTAPLFLFIMGVAGIFNVFNTDEYVRGTYSAMGTDEEGNRVEVNVMADTRTFIYIEVLNSAVNNNYWLLGRTPARGNDSDTFGVIEAELTGRDERLANEIGLANVFTWTGVVGVILYLLIFYRASYLAVNKSENIFASMLGIYVAFRWLYSWIEDVNQFNINYFILMIIIGLCFSESFRKMSDKDILIWARGMFDARYIRLQQYLLKKRKYETPEYSSIADMPQQKS